jgi:hypothetical protein
MAFSLLHTLRKIFFSITMLGIIFWHSAWTAPYLNILNYLIPIAGVLAVLNELALTLYLSFFFEKVQAHVVAKEDTQHNDMPVKNYDLVFEFQGASYSMRQSDSLFSSSINDPNAIQVLVHKRPPRLAFVDSFSQRYLYLLTSVFILWSVYSVYKNGI